MYNYDLAFEVATDKADDFLNYKPDQGIIEANKAIIKKIVQQVRIIK